MCRKVFTRKDLVLTNVFCMECGKETFVTRNTITPNKVYCHHCMPYESEEKRAADKIFFDSLNAAIGQAKLFELEKRRLKIQSEREREERRKQREINRVLRRQKREEELAIKSAQKELKGALSLKVPNAAIIETVETIIPPEPSNDNVDDEGFF